MYDVQLYDIQLHFIDDIELNPGSKPTLCTTF